MMHMSRRGRGGLYGQSELWSTISSDPTQDYQLDESEGFHESHFNGRNAEGSAGNERKCVNKTMKYHPLHKNETLH